MCVCVCACVWFGIFRSRLKGLFFPPVMSSQGDINPSVAEMIWNAEPLGSWRQKLKCQSWEKFDFSIDLLFNQDVILVKKFTIIFETVLTFSLLQINIFSSAPRCFRLLVCLPNPLKTFFRNKEDLIKWTITIVALLKLVNKNQLLV